MEDQLRKAALDYHRLPKPGKISVSFDQPQITVNGDKATAKFRQYFAVSGSRAWYCIPLEDDQGRLGILSFESRNPDFLSDAHFEFIKVLAGQADPGGRLPLTFYRSVADLVAYHAASMYRGYEILSSAAFRVTRNSNLYLQEEESRNLLESVRTELHNRRRGDAVRLEIEAGADPEIIERLRSDPWLKPGQALSRPEIRVVARAGLVVVPGPRLEREAARLVERALGVEDEHLRAAGRRGLRLRRGRDDLQLAVAVEVRDGEAAHLGRHASGRRVDREPGLHRERAALPLVREHLFRVAEHYVRRAVVLEIGDHVRRGHDVGELHSSSNVLRVPRHHAGSRCTDDSDLHSLPLNDRPRLEVMSAVRIPRVR